MSIKGTLTNIGLAAAVAGAAFICHTQSAGAADTTSWSYEDECIEVSCSNGEVEEYHEVYEQESLVEWGPGNIEEDLEFGSNRTSVGPRSCPTATMLNDFVTRLGRRVDTDDWQRHEWVCLYK